MASMGDAECLSGSCVRCLYGDLHSKVGHESVTRLPVGHYHSGCRRVQPTWSWLVRCRRLVSLQRIPTEFFNKKASFQQPRSCSASAEECHVLDLSQGDSRPVQVMPVLSRPRRGFSQTSLEKLTVVELKKMCKERTVKMPSLGVTDEFFHMGFMVKLASFLRNSPVKHVFF